jgi:hypothetical protein
MSYLQWYNPGMQKFDYQVRIIGSSEENLMRDTLNQVGTSGFRCVHFQLNPNGDSWTFIFERSQELR